MNIFSILITIAGLCLFETVSGIDNAIINAEVLSTMKPKARRWFLLWGMLFAVFVVRGVLPWLIVWIATPGIGPLQALTAAFSNDPHTIAAIQQTAPILLIAGAVFLIFIFFHWLFLEPKQYGLVGEKFFFNQGVWFFGVVSVILTSVVWLAIHRNPLLALGAVMGSTIFFVIHGFRENAEVSEQKLKNGSLSDVSKIFYLEIIDSAFSIDSVLGAFAFTFSVPLILIGNSLGAIIVRKLTVGNIERIKKYRYLKNGAMYSILVLGIIMLLNSFSFHVPEWVSPITTFTIVGYFFLKSKTINSRKRAI